MMRTRATSIGIEHLFARAEGGLRRCAPAPCCPNFPESVTTTPGLVPAHDPSGSVCPMAQVTPASSVHRRFYIPPAHHPACTDRRDECFASEVQCPEPVFLRSKAGLNVDVALHGGGPVRRGEDAGCRSHDLHARTCFVQHWQHGRCFGCYPLSTHPSVGARRTGTRLYGNLMEDMTASRHGCQAGNFLFLLVGPGAEFSRFSLVLAGLAAHPHRPLGAASGPDVLPERVSTPNARSCLG